MLYNFRDGNWHVKHAGPANWSTGVNPALYGTNVTFQCGNPGHFPLLGNVLNDGIRACCWRAHDGMFLVKSLGAENFWKIPPDSGIDGCDVMCQNGRPNDIPVIGNVFGDGTYQEVVMYLSLIF